MLKIACRIFFLFASFFGSIPLTGQEAGMEKFCDVDLDEAREMIAAHRGNDQFVLLDTRMQAEYDKGHLENAVFYNYHAEDFRERIDSLDKDMVYLVYCHSGDRSGKTVKFMKENSFSEAHNMKGGILAWKKAGYPVIR